MLSSRHFKKVTDLKRTSFTGVEGLLISDKTGEIGFININNLQKLPKLNLKVEQKECFEEETKDKK